MLTGFELSNLVDLPPIEDSMEMELLLGREIISPLCVECLLNNFPPIPLDIQLPKLQRSISLFERKEIQNQWDLIRELTPLQILTEKNNRQVRFSRRKKERLKYREYVSKDILASIPLDNSHKNNMRENFVDDEDFIDDFVDDDLNMWSSFKHVPKKRYRKLHHKSASDKHLKFVRNEYPKLDHKQNQIWFKILELWRVISIQKNVSNETRKTFVDIVTKFHITVRKKVKNPKKLTEDERTLNRTLLCFKRYFKTKGRGKKKAYACRKMFANKRPRVGGKFVKITMVSAPLLVANREAKERIEIAKRRERKAKKEKEKREMDLCNIVKKRKRTTKEIDVDEQNEKREARLSKRRR
jgi:hypothetical protein